METHDFGAWVLELDGQKVVKLTSRVYGPSDTEAAEVVWSKMITRIHQDRDDKVDVPPPAKWAEEVIDAGLDGSGPRLSYLSVVWLSVASNFPKDRHRAAVKHLMRLRKYRNLTWSDFRRMNLPDALIRARVDSAPAEVRAPLLRYIEAIDKWISKGVGFGITGKPRSGKSGCAAILAKAAASRGRSAYFIRVSELREAIKNDVAFSDDTSVWERCRGVDFLVLDNLTPEDGTLPYLNAAALTDLIAYRGERGRSTVVTMSFAWKPAGSTESYLVPLDIPGETFRMADRLKRELLEGERG